MTMTTSPASLVGSWAVDSDDDTVRARFGDVAMKFDADGSLTYAIRGDAKVKLLLAASADENRRNRHGVSPVGLAQTIATFPVAGLLR